MWLGSTNGCCPPTKGGVTQSCKVWPAAPPAIQMEKKKKINLLKYTINRHRKT
jgi:hypothetical protein